MSWPQAINLPPYPPSPQINVNPVAIRLLFIVPIWHHLDLVCPQLGLIGLESIPTYQPEDGPFWSLFFGRHHSGPPCSVVFTPDYQSSLPWLFSALRPRLQLPNLTFHQPSAKDRFSSMAWSNQTHFPRGKSLGSIGHQPHLRKCKTPHSPPLWSEIFLGYLFFP